MKPYNIKYIFCFCFLSLLLGAVLSGCGNGDKNIADLPDDMFEEGKDIVKLYALAYNSIEEDDNRYKAEELAGKFLTKYEGNTNNDDEELFVSEIKLLELKNDLIGLAHINESLSGEDEGVEEHKEEVKVTLLEIKERFGIILE